MANYPIPATPQYDPQVRKLENTDPANAETTFNPTLSRMVENTAAVKAEVEEHREDTAVHVTEAQKAAWDDKAAAGHTHDDRYYTEAEITAQLADKANLGHSHTAGEVGADPAGSAASVLTALGSHTGNKANPHGVTAAQVGAAPAAEGVRTLTHSKSGTVHRLTGLSGASGILSGRFKATAAFAEGNTFTIDGTTYAAALASGDALPEGAFASDSLVDVLIDTSTKKLGFKAGGGVNATLPPLLPDFALQAGNGKVTVTWSKLTASAGADCEGAVLVYGSHEPLSPFDGTRVILTHSDCVS